MAPDMTEVSEEVKRLLSEEDVDMENLQTITIEHDIEEDEDVLCTPIIMQILGINGQLQDLDDYFNELPSLQSKVDEQLSDLLHYIESNDLTPKQSVNMIKLIRKKRLERRELCNNYEIKRVYNAHKNKLMIDGQRPFFLTEIHKKAKELNQQYRYRQFGSSEDNNIDKKIVAEEEIKALLK